MPITIYQISNDVNNLLYIGITDGTIRARMGAHLGCARSGNSKPLYVAMRTIGAEHFFIEELEVLETKLRHVAEQRESCYINELKTAHPHGYNLRAPLTPEQVALIRYNPCGWSLAEMSLTFGVSKSLVGCIRTRFNAQDGGTWGVYQHVGIEHLPLQYQGTVSVHRNTRTINLDNYYDCAQAVARSI
jgi:GIY-YIG catalytic domain-containing protein